MAVEELVGDHTVLVGHVDARERHPEEAAPGRLFGVVLRNQRIENAELADHRRVDVGQQVVAHVVFVGERAELFLAVVAHAVDTDVFVLEEPQVGLQLDQLRSAIRSPHRRSIEDDDGLRVAPVRVEVDDATVLIGQRELRQPLADRRPGWELMRRRVATPGVTRRDLDGDPEVVGLCARFEGFVRGADRIRSLPPGDART